MIAGIAGLACLADAMRIPSILRQGQSRTVHIGIAAIVGVAAAAGVAATAGGRYAPAAGWIATATVYLIWTWASIAKMSATAIEVVVQQRHPGPAATPSAPIAGSLE